LIAIYLLNELMNSNGEAIYGVLSAVARDENLRAARANRVFGTDKRRIRTKNTVMQLPRNNCLYRANVIHRQPERRAVTGFQG
jgi:hypothetical protein